MKHRTQNEAALEVHQFFPLVKVGCSPDLATLLCSVYAPPCSGPRKPCRELCNRARSGCLPIMKGVGIPWPESLACEKFPAGGSGKLCFDRSNVNAVMTQPPLPTTSEADGEYLSLSSTTTMYFPQIVGSDSKRCIIIAPNLVPRAFSSLKMADRRNPGQGYCHVTHDEMAFSEIVSSVLRPCFVFLQSETIV